MKTAVAFMIFNRPDTTARVFEEIRRARPQRLLVVADGPRPDKPGEAEKCAAARAVVGGVDWDCEVLKNFAETNLGCRRRVSSGLDWVFDTVEEAIVLEDDCLPHPTFFRFCEELLEKYRHDERIAMVRGDNWPGAPPGDTASYRFSIYPSVWGWASWRRAWKNYDVEMRGWPEAKRSGLLSEWHDTITMTRYWEKVFDDTFGGMINTWDYQFVFSCWCQSQLSIVPRANLISNIGAGADSTHTSGLNNPRLNRTTEEMVFPLEHPGRVIKNTDMDMLGTPMSAHLERKMHRVVSQAAMQRGKIYPGAKRLIKDALKRIRPVRELHAYYMKLRSASLDKKKISEYLRRPGVKALNLGCGGNPLDGWLNTDIFYWEHIAYMDISQGLPLPDKSFDLVFAEHVIEHITAGQFDDFLAEARRIMKPGGRIRLATPDLDFYADMLLRPDSPKAAVFRRWYAERKGVPASGEAAVYAVNSIFYEHGHRFIFNEAMLRAKLGHAGFADIRRYEVGESDHPMFRGIEGHGKVADVGEEINGIETVVVEAELPRQLR